MAVLGVGRYADYLRRFLGVAGEGGTVGRELNPDLHATLDILGREEFSFLQGERRCMGVAEYPQNAVLRAGITFSNPTGQIAILTKVVCRTNPVNLASVEFGVGTVQNPLGSSSKSAKDTRWRGTTPSCTWAQGDVLGFAPITRTALRAQQAANADYWDLLQCPIIIQPNSSFMWAGGTNFGLVVIAEWIERPVTQGELDG